jgi:hypothetical protein
LIVQTKETTKMEGIYNLMIHQASLPRKNCETMVGTIETSLDSFQNSPFQSKLHKEIVTSEMERLQFLKKLLQEYSELKNNPHSNIEPLTKNIYSEFAKLVTNIKKNFPKAYENVKQIIESKNKNKVQLVKILLTFETEIVKLQQQYKLLESKDPEWYKCGYYQEKFPTPAPRYFKGMATFRSQYNDNIASNIVSHILWNWLESWKNTSYYKLLYEQLQLDVDKQFKVNLKYFGISTNKPPILPPISQFHNSKNNSLKSKLEIEQDIHETEVPLTLYMFTILAALQEHRMMINYEISYNGYSVMETIRSYVPNQVHAFAPNINISINFIDNGVIFFSNKNQQGHRIVFDSSDDYKTIASFLVDHLNKYNNFVTISLSIIYNHDDGHTVTQQGHQNSIIVEQFENSLHMFHFEPLGTNYINTEPEVDEIKTKLPLFFKHLKDSLLDSYDSVRCEIYNASSELQLVADDYKYLYNYKIGFCYCYCVFWTTCIVSILCELSVYLTKHNNMLPNQFRLYKWVPVVSDMMMYFTCNVDDQNNIIPNLYDAYSLMNIIFAQVLQYFNQMISSTIISPELKKEYFDCLYYQIEEFAANSSLNVKTTKKTFRKYEDDVDTNLIDTSESTLQTSQKITQNMSNEWTELSNTIPTFGINCQDDGECNLPLKCINDPKIDDLNKTCLHPDKRVLYSSCSTSNDCFSDNCLQHSNGKFYCVPKNQTSSDISNDYNLDNDSDY